MDLNVKKLFFVCYSLPATIFNSMSAQKFQCNWLRNKCILVMVDINNNKSSSPEEAHNKVEQNVYLLNSFSFIILIQYISRRKSSIVRAMGVNNLLLRQCNNIIRRCIRNCYVYKLFSSLNRFI